MYCIYGASYHQGVRVVLVLLTQRTNPRNSLKVKDWKRLLSAKTKIKKRGFSCNLTVFYMTTLRILFCY